jgi:serine protease Do
MVSRLTRRIDECPARRERGGWASRLPGRAILSLLAAAAVAPVCSRANDLPLPPPPLADLFEQRVRSVVAVEFFVETETERRPSTVVGIVADAQGLIVLLDSAIPGWLPPARLRDFRIYPAGSREGSPGEYLGQDYLTGWHFLRAPEAIHGRLVPATSFGVSEPRIGDEVWGIGVMSKEFDFQAFLLSGRVALMQQLPQRIGYALQDVASPGGPVFARSGAFVGWAGNPVPQERVLFLEDERYNVGLQNTNGTGSFYLASEVVPFLDRVPSAPTGQVVPWLGVVGLQPVEPEVASFLKLSDQAAVVVSDVIEGGPAAIAGIQKRDILVSLNGQPLPRFRPDRVITAHLEREILRRRPGEVIRFGVVRGEERHEIEVMLGGQPKPLKEAGREYFERLGVTVREFVLFDAVQRRLTETSEQGVIAEFVKPNSPANAAGLQQGDLIREIDGRPVGSFADAVAVLKEIVSNPARAEFVLLISRGTETQVIRVRLK